MRNLSFFDQILIEVDTSLRTAYTIAPTTERANPANSVEENQPLTDEEKKCSAVLMRINHAGEVSAQGLYRGQALTAKRADIKKQMQRSAMEENDHLNWCENRLKQLGSHKSYFSPLWYWGSFSIGAVAGLVGDKWSLGFVKETEDQVVRHLEQHIVKLPIKDLPSLVILQQMKQDEQHHADIAVTAGAAKLPWAIRRLMMP
ncbi:MAG: 2-polyprenyl-3-methyl-6-methoxy-1,4-benzoquinone monooxygenase, partial [Cocleimonas sp.]|nr:2-polyprenyl-3-methyl-6-methoxy-1,4-benzoquinone monooxygenase [Cocleimonas sp.]